MADHRHLPALTEYLKKYLWVFLNTKFTAPDIFQEAYSESVLSTESLPEGLMDTMCLKGQWSTRCLNFLPTKNIYKIYTFYINMWHSWSKLASRDVNNNLFWRLFCRLFWRWCIGSCCYVDGRVSGGGRTAARHLKKYCLKTCFILWDATHSQPLVTLLVPAE